MTPPDPGPKRFYRETALAAAVLLALIVLCRPIKSLPDYTSTPLIDPAGVLQVYPWVHFNADQYDKGHFPLWNPYTALGQPHLANVQTGALFPLWWAWSALGGGESGWGVLLLGRLWLAGIFWFVFARKKLLSFWGALVAASAYAAGGYSLWFVQLVDLNSQMLLPLLLLALPNLVEKAGIGRLVWASLLIALAILGGHPEAAFITVFMALLYTGASITINLTQRHRDTEIKRREEKNKKNLFLSFSVSLCLCVKSFRLTPKLVLLAVSGLIGVLITFATLLPFLNYLPRCWTMHGPGFGFFHLDPRAFFNLVLPGIHALFTDMPREIPVQYLNYGALRMLALPYSATAVPGNFPGAGIVVSGLALFGIIKARRAPWPILFFIGLLTTALGLTLGLPLFRLIALIPPFNMNSNFKFFFSEIHACLAVLAGVGAEAVWRNLRKSPAKVAAAGIMNLLIIVWIAADWDKLFSGQRYHYLPPPHIGPLPLLHLIAALFVIFFTMALVLFPYRHTEPGPGWKKLVSILASVFVLAPVFAALWHNGKQVVPYIKPSILPGDYIRKVTKYFSPEDRLLGLDDFWPANLASLNGIKDIRSSDALFYKPYVEFLNRVNGFTAEQNLGFFYPSYFTRPSTEHLLAEGAKGLSITSVVGERDWAPYGIIDDIIIKGKGVFVWAKPSRVRANRSIIYSDPEIYYDKCLSVEDNTGLLLHAPVKATYRPTHEQQLGVLSFTPSQKHALSDGSFFQVIAKASDETTKLLYAYNNGLYQGFDIEHRDMSTCVNPPSVKIMVRQISELQFSALPGPRDNVDNDSNSLDMLSWLPTEPSSYKDWLITMGTFEGSDLTDCYLYDIPHNPWVHFSGQEKALNTERSAGDRVAVEVDGGGELVVHEAWYPGWRVEVDGRSGVIEIPADKVSWRVAAPEGAKRAEFWFAPMDFRVGLWVSLATLGVLPVAAALKRKGANRAQAARPAVASRSIK